MRLPPSLTAFRSGDIGVDLRTDTTVLCARSGGLVIAEPSVLAVQTRGGGSLAAGTEALELLDRHDIAAIRPIKDGAIIDLRRAAEMLRYLMAKVGCNARSRPRVVASASSGMSAVQMRAVAEACVAAGAREAHLIARPVAAALGCGLPVHEPIASMVLDIGANNSEVAMISLRAIVASRSIPVGAQDIDQRIVAHIKRAHMLLIDEHTLEHIKAEIGSPRPRPPSAHIEILGRDVASGRLMSARPPDHDIRDLLERPITRIIEAVKETLARTPPQLAADVIDTGITLTGRDSLLRAVGQRIALETGMPAHVAESAHTCTAIGAARSLEQQPARVHHRDSGSITALRRVAARATTSTPVRP